MSSSLRIGNTADCSRRSWGMGRRAHLHWPCRNSGKTHLHWLSAAPVDLPKNQLEDEQLARLEAVLFVAKEPLSTRRLANLANLVDATKARKLIGELRRRYEASSDALSVVEVAGGFQLLTRPRVASYVAKWAGPGAPFRLSAAALETLTIVAHRQPVPRSEVEAIRGVACDEMLRQLMERGLLRIVGRSDQLGRPLLYGTTRQFLAGFGLNSLDDLPRASQLARHALPLDAELGE